MFTGAMSMTTSVLVDQVAIRTADGFTTLSADAWTELPRVAQIEMVNLNRVRFLCDGQLASPDTALEYLQRIESAAS